MSEIYDVRPGDGLGPLRLGMTKDEAVAAVGEPIFAATGPLEYIVQWPDVQVYLASDAPHDVTAIAAAAGGDVQATLEGVELLGADAEAALAALRERGVEVELDERSDTYVGAGWAFEAIDGRIDNLAVEPKA